MPTLTATTRLLNPGSYEAAEFDPATQRVLRATIDWFEAKGKSRLTAETRSDDWYSDFIEFLASERAFATLLTPSSDAGGDPDKRWDTARNARFNEILGFYGLPYWYAWQVTILGLGPIWQSDNEAARRRAAELLEEGAVFAFGLSERDHGADIYSTDMILTPDGEGGFRATGGKYYIGNGNVARMVSVFGRRADVDGPDGYVFFAADSQHPAYKLVGNVVHSQMYVSSFELEDYPVAAEDVLHVGSAAFEAALNTINVGKFNLGFCSIGLAEHCFYETVTQAEGRVLFGRRVTEFGQIRRILSQAYSRLLAAKLYGARAVDYVRSASREDRRYLLYTPINKMQVTMEGERIVRLLAEVISAKGFERDSYFDSAKSIVDGLPKLEGTVHVNRALLLKFLPAYLFGSEELAAPPARRRRRVPVRPGPDPRPGQDQVPRLAPDPRRLCHGAERRTVPRAGRRAPRPASGRRADARPDDRPRLPAGARAAVRANPLRPADPRAGRARRDAARCRRPGVRDVGARLLGDRDRAAREGFVNGGPAAVGAGQRPKARHRRGPGGQGVRRGPRTRRCVRDARLAAGGR